MCIPKAFAGMDLWRPVRKSSETASGSLTCGRASLLFRLPTKRRAANAAHRTEGNGTPKGALEALQGALDAAPDALLGLAQAGRPEDADKPNSLDRQTRRPERDRVPDQENRLRSVFFENKGGPRISKRALARSAPTFVLSRREDVQPKTPYPGVGPQKNSIRARQTF